MGLFLYCPIGFSKDNPVFCRNIFPVCTWIRGQLYRLMTFFFAGSLLSFVNMDKINKLYGRLLLFVILVLSLYFHIYKFVSPFIYPLLTIMIGSLSTPLISSLSKNVGDISYGVYIYGFLIQQLLMNYFELNSLFLMLLSLLITYFIFYLSWHLVEKKMLKYKKHHLIFNQSIVC